MKSIIFEARKLCASVLLLCIITTFCGSIVVSAKTTLPKNNLLINNLEQVSKENNSVIIEHTYAFGSSGKLIEVNPTREERIVLASYTLTKEQTKTLASNIKKINSGQWNFVEWLIGLSSPFGAFVALCSSLARQATFQNDVVYAANHNKRVKVIITDSKNTHTSYSTQVTYQIVN